MFREPRFFECAPVGDLRRWMWVMEPSRGHIYGKAFSLAMSEIILIKNLDKHIDELKKDAYDTMIERSKDPEDRYNVPEGSMWEAFV